MYYHFNWNKFIDDVSEVIKRRVDEIDKKAIEERTSLLEFQASLKRDLSPQND